MAFLEISDDDLQWLKDLAEEMRTQDNRMTADPYFFTMVITKHRHVGEGNGIKDVLVNTESGNYEQYDTLEEALADESDEDSLETFGLVHEQSHHNFFLTQSASTEYLKRHSGKIGSDEPVHDFVDYADRNPQLTRLFRILKSIK